MQEIQVEKRDGRTEELKQSKVETAIRACLTDGGLQPDDKLVSGITNLVMNKIMSNGNPIHVENIQDKVENSLMEMGLYDDARRYIRYREKKSKERDDHNVSPEMRQKVEESLANFNNELSKFLFYRSYARYREEDKRRETWSEAIDRVIIAFEKISGDLIPKDTFEEIRDYILAQKVMPSMRIMNFAGPALDRDSTLSYNCSSLNLDSIDAFAEELYILMCGCGVGFSVELFNSVDKLPRIRTQNKKIPVETFNIPDTAEGWAEALRVGLNAWFTGKDILFDYSSIRPAGARLKVKGGFSSGPGPLKELLDFAKNIILSKQGQKLVPIDAHDIACMIAQVVVSGGQRRSACISLSDPDDYEMRMAKSGSFWNTAPYRALANNSAAFEEKPTATEFMEEWLALAKSGTGERGIFNRQAALKCKPKRRKAAKFSTNPCLSGDTLVYCADGRGNVPISQLAESGEDVPVFCLNDKGNMVVRYMRHPRVTGYDEKILKITLDNGSKVKVTPNHKFLMKDGIYKEAKYLLPGDSLNITTRFEASIKELFSKANSNSQDYLWVNNGQRKTKAEHRLIVEFAEGKIPEGCVVHHKDGNTQNNCLDNLQIMTKKNHDTFHGDLIRGNGNPMRKAILEWDEEKWKGYKKKHSDNNTGSGNGNFSGVSNDDLKKHALTLTLQLGSRFSGKEWVEYARKNGLPQHFSKWREDHLGGIIGLAKWAALELGFDNIEEDPRVVKSYRKYTEQGYDCEIQNHKLIIIKHCEVCGKIFQTNISCREQGICSNTCFNKMNQKNPELKARILESARITHEKKKKELRDKQLKIYSDLLFSLDRAPSKKEWVNCCKLEETSCEISRKSSPFPSYKAMQEAAIDYNHKVMSIRKCKNEKVYNGTVDEFHNFFIGGFESKTRSGKRKFTYLNNLQCGEILLRNKEMCNLSEVVLRSDDTWETIKEKIRIAVIIGTIQSLFTSFPFLSEEWKRNAEEERLLGVSLTGILDCPLFSCLIKDPRNTQVIEKIEELRNYAIQVNEEYAKLLGINSSAAITTGKPSGCRPENGLVTTKEGIFTLGEIVKNHPLTKAWYPVLGLTSEQGDNIIQSFRNGEAEVLKVTLSYGMSVESTRDHKWSVISSDGTKRWMKTEELSCGDILEIVPGVYNSTTHSQLFPVEKAWYNCYDIITPEILNEDLSWFLGYLWGNGCLSLNKYRIRFMDGGINKLEKVVRILLQEFGIKAEIHAASGIRKAWVVETGSHTLWNWLEVNGLMKYGEEELNPIPKAVRCSSYTDILAFLAGLIDSDGCVHLLKDGSATVILSSSDEKFSKSVQDIALAVGIILGHSHNTEGKNLQQVKSMWLMGVCTGTIEHAIKILEKYSVKMQKAVENLSFKSWRCLSGKHHYRLGKVKKVESIGKLPTFDVEVENSHWFYAGAVKSHNSVSILVNSSSGIHPRWSKYYIRRVRINIGDPLLALARDNGVPMSPEVGQSSENATTWVLSFPVKSPENCITRHNITALEQLELWLTLRKRWAEHSISCTCYVDEGEWLAVGNWVYEHWDSITGLSFLPKDNGIYPLAPYTEIAEEEYEKLKLAWKPIDYCKLPRYEKVDTTQTERVWACTGDKCEIA